MGSSYDRLIYNIAFIQAQHFRTLIVSTFVLLAMIVHDNYLRVILVCLVADSLSQVSHKVCLESCICKESAIDGIVCVCLMVQSTYLF